MNSQLTRALVGVTDPVSYGVADDSAKNFSNEIHCIQAMRDAGAVTTITADDELLEPDGTA